DHDAPRARRISGSIAGAVASHGADAIGRAHFFDAASRPRQPPDRNGVACGFEADRGPALQDAMASRELKHEHEHENEDRVRGRARVGSTSPRTSTRIEKEEGHERPRVRITSSSSHSYYLLVHVLVLGTRSRPRRSLL